MFLFGAMFGFVSSTSRSSSTSSGSALFPVAFAAMAGMMAVSSFLNSRIVKRFGMRRLSHFALIVYIGGSILVAFSLAGFMPLWLFFNLLMIRAVRLRLGGVQRDFRLSMEPLGAIGRTAASVFGFIQTVGGALLGTMIGLQFNGDDADRARLPRHGLARAWLRAHRRERLGCSASARSTPEAARPPRGSCGCPAGP